MIRDSHSKALLETDAIELQKYRREKKQDREIETIKRDLMLIKSSINRINDMLEKVEMGK
jgi:hypothetical protein